MDCFKIATLDEDYDEDGAVPRPTAASKVSWVSRSLSVASSSRRSESARDFTDSLEFFTQPRANNLRVFTFGELKAATRGFSRGMMIGEGGFGCVYRGVVRVSDVDDGNCSGSNMDVAVKQLNRNGFQARLLFPVPLSMYICVCELCSVTGFLGIMEHDMMIPSFLSLFQLVSALPRQTGGLKKTRSHPSSLARTIDLKDGAGGVMGFLSRRMMNSFYYIFEPQSFLVSKFLLQGQLMGSVILHSSIQGHKEWINEVNFLGVVKHPNLVKLVGYCAEDDERGIQRLLVYELMHNKSLEDHLFIREVSPLSWMARLRIAQDAARGLAHLHEEKDFQIIFRDLKTSNILLDENFNAKLSDFGLARQGPAAGLSHISTTSVVGTAGYAAPEYIQTGRLTAKSDVWSFGVVLYELITGRRAVEKNMPRNEQKLLDWVRPYVSDSRKFHLIVDPRLEGQYCIKSAQKLASLANKCLAKNAKSRPKMSELVEMLGKIISETSSENDSAPQHPKETQGKKEETEKSIRKFNWKNWTLR
ncbi:hypothetical protein RHSIM_Rhsim01G0228100 [Rhododendron simsii]|uniref:Protein kinase domain-containing protein n=1 Tax=Rhododendron simsii TaxID=118357 RepID=A0A834HIH1_RHOSS|nr:hypothetical protein RHSIM_Rhsim01G0228100 [Rhododendron simsii]